MSRRSNDGTDASTSNGASGYSLTNRRSFVKFLGAGATVGAIGASAFSTNIAGAQSTASFGPDSGFADTSWFDDDVQVITITELSKSAIQDAFSTSGPRLVVFEVAGVVDLGGDRLQITENNCWVAGQTAPSPGITFTRGMVQVSANDCVVQHIRSRIGPGSDGNIQGNDSLNTADGTQNNVVDHVTASWGTDECLSVGYDTNNTTVSNCLIYEGLYDPYGDESDHNYAQLIGDGASNVTLAGNVYAKTRGRVPRLKSDTSTAVVNNVMYFYNEATNLDSSSEASIVGNVYLPQDREDSSVEGGNAYLEDNHVEAGELYSGTSVLDSPPLWPDGLTALPSGDVLQHNLTNAGARPADRTGNDQRIVQEIRNREDEAYYDSPYDYWIPDPSAVGGYPTLPENAHSLNVPDTGLRQWLADWAAQVEGGSSGTPWPTPEPTPTATPTPTPIDPGPAPTGSGTATVQGGGEDIWNTADAFHYFYASASGDFDVVANVTSVENTNEFAKAGLMARASTAADAANVMVRKTPGHDTSVQWRSASGGDTLSLTSGGSGESEIDGGTIAADWQRLVRIGDTVQAYASGGGSNWTLLAELSDVSLPSTVQLGLAVTSHSAGTLCTGQFANVAGFTPTNSQDVGSVDAAGSASGSFGGGGGGPPTLPDGSQPQDLNGDGLYRDVNGNGRLDNDDVVTYFENMESSAISDNVGFYDYNGNGRIDFDDLVTLFESL